MNDRSNAADYVAQKQREMFGENSNYRKAFTRDQQINTTLQVTNNDNLNKLNTGFEELIHNINKSLEGLNDSNRLYKEMGELINSISNTTKTFGTELDNAEGNAEAISKIFKELEKQTKNMNKESLAAYMKLKNENQALIDAAAEFPKIMKKESQTYFQNFSSNLVKAKNQLLDLSKAFNLQKLVTGGLSVEDLRKMQGNVKINLGLDDSGFMGVQRELLTQNRQLLEKTGDAYLTFNDAVSYMQSIKDYSFRNYNQMTAMYKQVSIGTRYLGITTQSMNSLVKATNALADESFMNRQLGLISALSLDKTVAEDTTSLADFVGRNATAVGARYRNANDVLTDSVAINSVVSSILGNESQSVVNLMEEIMGSTEFSQLSQGAQMWLNWAGMSSQVQQQMRSGNLNMQQIISGALNGIQNMSWEQQTALQGLGLKDIVTLGGNYSQNASRYQQLLSSQSSLLRGMDPESAIEKAAEAFNNKTGVEKFFDKITTELGLQNQNWRSITGIVQGINAVVTAMMGIISGAELLATLGILKNTSIMAATGGAGGASALLGSGKLAGLAKFALPAVGIGLGINDAINMQGSTGKGWLADSARGFLLGTGSAQKSTGANALSVLGNTGKYAAIGAGIGSIIPGVGTLIGAGVGAIGGIVAGLIGTTMDNKKALEDNTKATNKNNSVLGDVATTSYLEKLYQNSSSAGGIGGTGAYPWSVSSNFGTRSVIQTKNGATSTFHTGIDLTNKEGTPIGANWAGIVKGVGTDSYGANYVILGHDNGFDTAYWHLKSRSPLKVGQTVNAGDLIGYMGQTGLATGPHLHFEVRKQGAKGDARYINPASYITNGIFSANGDEYAPITDGSVLTSNDAEVQYIYKNNTPAGATGEVSTGGNYATSSDVDRLIETMIALQQNQNEQKELMQMLAGNNTFRYGRE